MTTRFCSIVTVVLCVALGMLTQPFASSTVQATGNIIYVNINAPSTTNNSGTSWANASTNLRDAIETANVGTEIWVATGIYTPTKGLADPLKQDVSFTLKDDVAIYGGFSGKEKLREERNWKDNITILSGDLANDDIKDSTGVITNSLYINGQNSYHVLSTSGVTNTAILDGFTITGGKTSSLIGNESGGGMYNNNSNPTLSNLIFAGNFAYVNGGGLYNNNGSPKLNNVTFINNYAYRAGGGMSSTSAMHTNTSKPTLTNVSFINNITTIDGGGGMYNVRSNPTLNNVSFISNQGAIGGGMYNIGTSNPSLTNVSFTGNTANQYGGAMYNGSRSKAVLTNVSFTGNQAAQYGGGIHNFYSSATLTNVTIAGNNASEYGGGIYSTDGSETSIQNSIIWGNSSSIYTVPSDSHISASTVTISSSLIDGCNPGGVWNGNCGQDQGNNLEDVDPLFVNTPNHNNAPTTIGNVRLQSNSPAIDQGNNLDNDSQIDLDEVPRINGNKIDLGAYEYGYAKLTLATEGQGNITQDPLGNIYPISSNSTVTLTATAKLGWSFAGWSGALSGTTPTRSIVMDTNRVITATFTNDAPTANAGADQTVSTGITVTLNGSSSFDEDPDQDITYKWEQISGTPVTLSDDTSAQPSFTAPSNPAVLTFQLTVTDNWAVSSLADSVTITVSGGDSIPTREQTAKGGDLVTLDGSAFANSQGKLPPNYKWSQTQGTPVTLSDPMASQPSFSAPNNTDVLSFVLLATNNAERSDIVYSETVKVSQSQYQLFLPAVHK